MSEKIRFEPNEFKPEFAHALGLSSFPMANSASRNQMFGSHSSQMLPILGATQRRIQTGVEAEYAKYTFSVKAPTDMLVLEIVELYPVTIGRDSIRHNPLTCVIYEDIHTKQIGCLEMPQYCSNHQYFGFTYARRPGLRRITVGQIIEKDTIFLDSPNVDDDGGYRFGLELNVAMMSHPATSEDGIAISRDVLPRLAFKKFVTREVEWGSNQFPLNLYGDDQNYKPFPEIGSTIRDDGLLMALRTIDPDDYAVAERSVKQTQRVEFTFDQTVYANGPGGRVIDVRVIRDPKKTARIDQVDAQTEKYNKGRVDFYMRLMASYRRLHKLKHGMISLTPQFQNMLVTAESVIMDVDPKRPKIARQFKCEPLDFIRVEFIIEYTITPNIGFKLTDTFGGW